MFMVSLCVANVGLLEGGEHEETEESVLVPGMNGESQTERDMLPAKHLTSSYYKLYLSIGILVSAIFFLAIVIYGITRTAKYTANDIVTGAGLIIVVQGTLFVVIDLPQPKL